MSYTLCMIFFLTAGLHFSDSVEAGMFILIYFCLIFAQKSETSSRAAHFSLSTVTAYPFLFKHRGCEPCCRLPCEHHSRAHPWLPPPRYGQPGPAMATGHCPPLSAEVGAVPGLWGRAGKVSFLFSFFWGKLPWGLHKWDGEQQVCVTYLCAAESREPLCAWDTHEQSSRKVPHWGTTGTKHRPAVRVEGWGQCSLGHACVFSSASEVFAGPR